MCSWRLASELAGQGVCEVCVCPSSRRPAPLAPAFGAVGQCCTLRRDVRANFLMRAPTAPSGGSGALRASAGRRWVARGAAGFPAIGQIFVLTLLRKELTTHSRKELTTHSHRAERSRCSLPCVYRAPCGGGAEKRNLLAPSPRCFKQRRATTAYRLPVPLGTPPLLYVLPLLLLSEKRRSDLGGG